MSVSGDSPEAMRGGCRASRRRMALAMAFLGTSFVAVPSLPAQPLRVGGSWSGYVPQRATAEAFRRATRSRVFVEGIDNKEWFRSLARQKVDVLIYGPQPRMDETAMLAAAFPEGSPQIVRHTIGQFVVGVVVHKDNPVKELTMEALKLVLAGKTTNWKQLGPANAKIVVWSEPESSKSREILANLLQGIPLSSGIGQVKNCDAIFAAVGKDPKAMGLFLYQESELRGVKLLGIRPEAGTREALPTDADVYSGAYPLTEPLMLWHLPSASDAARSYCEFALGAEGAGIASKYFLFPEYNRQQFLSARRLAELKEGKGPSVSSVGTGAYGPLVSELGREYVRAKDLLQLQHRSGPEVVAVELFVKGADLLFLDAPPGPLSMAQHSEQWNQMAPQETVIAGRAVAVVVNLANPLEAMTPAQLRAVLAGEIDNWKKIGGADARIACNAPRPADPSSRLVAQELLGHENWKVAAWRKDSREVLGAVATDANAVGFVDAAIFRALDDSSTRPSTQQAVKVLGIRMGKPDAERVVLPTAETIANARYPLSQRLLLYVNPKAGKPAQDLAAFLASGGRSVTSPFFAAETSTRDIFLKYGLLPGIRGGGGTTRPVELPALPSPDQRYLSTHPSRP